MGDQKPEDSPVRCHLRKDVLQLNTYVALHHFIPQDSQDLEIRPGDRILLLDGSGEDWWKQVRAGDRVLRCHRTFIGCKEQGQISVKEGQICVSSEDERGDFIRVTSGKKRGFVPCDILEDI
ncbi:hypothetical protein ANANG_G00004690 [Anguilla anguilla]|uniref:SH3 domain-containing protein n=1 Tax=Anguilla anguilla TaxID=7936 RepID=A0A9D3S5B6_ANGAN|nr:hypothetical protein ANANG_G00004690 [Anguilla anguilla]